MVARSTIEASVCTNHQRFHSRPGTSIWVRTALHNNRMHLTSGAMASGAPLAGDPGVRATERDEDAKHDDHTTTMRAEPIDYRTGYEHRHVPQHRSPITGLSRRMQSKAKRRASPAFSWGTQALLRIP